MNHNRRNQQHKPKSATTNTIPWIHSKWLVEQIRAIHAVIRLAAVGACEDPDRGDLSQIVEDAAGDAIYAVGCVSEELAVDLFEKKLAQTFSMVLIVEGLSEGKLALPRRTRVRANPRRAKGSGSSGETFAILLEDATAKL